MLPDAKVTIKDGALNKIDNAPLKTEHPTQIKIPIIDTTKGFIPGRIAEEHRINSAFQDYAIEQL